MNDIDERLKELVAGRCSCQIEDDERTIAVVFCPLHRAARLAIVSLLRARRHAGRLARLMRSSLKFWPAEDHPKPCGEDMCWFCFLEGELESAVADLETALADTELEEVL